MDRTAHCADLLAVSVLSSRAGSAFCACGVSSEDLIFEARNTRIAYPILSSACSGSRFGDGLSK